MEVVARTTGDTPDADGYTVSLNGADGRHLGPNGTATFSEVDAGSHQVELSGFQVNCELDGARTRTVSVTAGQTARVAFDVLCPLALWNRIAFISDRDGDWEIWTINPDGTDPQQVTDNRFADVSPAWSPDGTRIAFASDRDGDFEIWTINLENGSLLNLTNDPGWDALPHWGPAP